MKVVHEHGKQRVEGSGSGMFLLTNKHGNFFSLCPEGNITKYNGLIHYDNEREEYAKTIESMSIGEPISTVINRLTSVERRYENGAADRFWLSSQALHYMLEGYHGELLLDLDMRPVDDGSTDGRNYSVHQDQDALFIRYERDGYEQYLVIKGVKNFRPIGDWQERHYSYDERRNDNSTFWIYRAGAITVDGEISLVITRSTSLENATLRARRTAAHSDDIIAHLEEHSFDERSIDASLALASLDSLVVKRQGEPYGIMAGLPWFRLFWSRDELISLGALIKAERFSLAKEILTRYYELLDEPLSAHYPHGGLVAADSLGWLAKRTDQLLNALEERGLTSQYFRRLELAHLHDRLAMAVERRTASLVRNGPGETWMDAASSGDDRAGARIEIQAGRLAALSLLGKLAEKTGRKRVWAKREIEFRDRVKNFFFKDGKLADGFEDETQRPNVYLAYYLYPQLLLPDEWKAAFDYNLSKLWLEWGGLATIDTGHELFHPRYTGAGDESYHRGDSWYWVNALAALCLKHLDCDKWRDTIARLTDGCLDDLRWQGAMGHCSELSSAEPQEWGGTFAQAWSAAMLYELLTE
ncbi:hypothetical protein GOV07_00875 [Candidatus Woesearchaeota archaeon]|nr:hypothetical protein [Candidatus Woesearchaeota archaeon]